MIKVYVASYNRVKLDAVKQVFEGFEVKGMLVDSEVPLQPISDLQTMQGALHRAKNLPTQSIRIGLEGGVEMYQDMLYVVNWGVLMDEHDQIYYAGGARIPLPETIKTSILIEKKELATAIDEYANMNDVRSHQGAIGILTSSMVTREEVYVHIVKLLYGQYLKGRKS